ncbi:hypothetical protein Q1695_004116 [Nippostrongylus brasiliensis]|nr:hypothetical protein Q1695_004116 [Nippostrongylus brasiliensis]
MEGSPVSRLPYVAQTPQQCGGIIWNCETEYNLKKIREQLLDLTTNVTYKNFGVNMANADGEVFCYINAMYGITDDWVDSAISPPNLVYGGGSDTYFANVSECLFEPKYV